MMHDLALSGSSVPASSASMPTRRGRGGPCRMGVFIWTDADPFTPVRVACGKCPDCVANIKQDRAGRMMAEAATSAVVVFLTLTIADLPVHVARRPGEAWPKFTPEAAQDFDYTQVQRMMWHFRKDLWREGYHIRMACVGEKGSKRGRAHWHLLLFSDQDIPRDLIFAGWKPRPKGRLQEDWKYWRHGAAEVEFISNSAAGAAGVCRYIASYLNKTDKGAVKFTSSNRPGLGAKYLADVARDTARAGLPLRDTYTFAGVYKGVPAERLLLEGRAHANAMKNSAFRLFGTSMVRSIEAYKAAWDEFHPGRPMPMTDFLLRHDPDAIQPRRPRGKEFFSGHDLDAPRSDGGPGLRKLDLPVRVHDHSHRETLYRDDLPAGPVPVGDLVINRHGVAKLQYRRNGRLASIRNGSFAGLIDAPHEQLAKWEKRLHDLRGPLWKPTREYHAAQKEAAAIWDRLDERQKRQRLALADPDLVALRREQRAEARADRLAGRSESVRPRGAVPDFARWSRPP